MLKIPEANVKKVRLVILISLIAASVPIVALRIPEQVYAAIVADDVVCNGCVGINGDATNDIANSAVTNSKIAPSAVTNTKLAFSSVTSGKIKDLGVGLVDMAPNSVDGSKIVNLSVTLDDLAANSVNSSKIADGSVGLVDLAANSVDGSKVVDNSLTADDLAASSVGTSEIADGAIGKADVSTSFLKLVQLLDDSAGNAAGWDPNGASKGFTISDNAVQSASAIGITIDRQAVPDPPIPVGGLPY